MGELLKTLKEENSSGLITKWENIGYWKRKFLVFGGQTILRNTVNLVIPFMTMMRQLNGMNIM